MEDIVTVELFGELFKFKAEPGVSNVQDVADFLTEEVNKVQKRQFGSSTGITKFALLLVAALNISNEYFELKQKYAEVTDGIEKRAASIIKSVDEKMT